jgi:hypothetical protein
MWGLWWTKRHWGRFSSSTSVSPANHSTDFSIIIITRGWHYRPLSGRSVEWTLIPPPPMQNKKKFIETDQVAGVTLLAERRTKRASKLYQVIKLLTCIGKVPGSNLGRSTDYTQEQFSWFSSVLPGECWNSILRHERFVPQFFQFILHYRSTIRSNIDGVTDSVVK